MILPGKLTCPLKKNSGWKNTFLLKELRFRGHVSFQGLKIPLQQLTNVPWQGTILRWKFHLPTINFSGVLAVGFQGGKKLLVEVMCDGIASRCILMWDSGDWVRSMRRFGLLKLTANATENWPFAPQKIHLIFQAFSWLLLFVSG